jgi:hypothetical protein
MSTSRNRIVLIVLGGVVVLWLLWTILGSLWLNPVAALETRIEKLKSQVNGYTVSDERLSEVEGSINGYISQTLGGSLEEVDHQLRSRLNRLGESVGLKDLSVGTGRSVAMMSPGKNDFKGASRRELREEIDFVEVEGRLSGITDWPGVLELLDRLDTASWLNKIESIRLREAGSRMQVTVQLRTLFIPGRSPAVEPVDQWTKDRMTAMAELASCNPFMLPQPPPPPAKPKPRPQPRTPTQPAPPDWQITGITGIGDAGEVWIRNVRSGQTRRLSMGDRVGDLVLETIQGDQAHFKVGESLVSIQVGQLLKDRTLVHK